MPSGPVGRRFRFVIALLVVPLVLSVVQAPALLAASTAAFDSRFGAVEAYRASAQADEAGVRWTRLVFWWSGLQPNGPKSWNNFYFPDNLLQAELDSGRQVVGILLNTPSWAGDGSPNSPPRGLDLPVNHADNNWAKFARAMAERYRGRIDHWVIWNEPDVWDAGSPTHTWSGTLEQFYRLQKVGYLAMKQGNPSARVGLAAMTYWWDYYYQRQQYFERFLQLAERDPEAPANNWFFDAAVLHLYNESAGLYRAPTLFKELMAARGFGKPIWINETNVAPWDDPINPMPRRDFRATLDEQASFVVQAFSWGLAAGVERISVYPFHDGDTPPGNELMGMVRGDGTTRPAYQALKTVTRYLYGVVDGRVESDGEVVKIIFRRDGATITVAWSQTPRQAIVAIPASVGSALVVDKYGRESRVYADGGAYQLTLEPATANTVNGDPSLYLIGGSPLLLIEGALSFPSVGTESKVQSPKSKGKR